MALPKVVTIETVSDCNLNCPYCAIHNVKHSRKNKYIELPLFKSIVAQCRDFNPYIWIDYMGEPTLHPDFFEIVKIINSENMKFAMESNATLWSDKTISDLAQSKLDKIIVTLEPNNELFTKYRSSKNFDSVVWTLKEFIKRKSYSAPKLELQMIVNPDNYNYLNKFKELAFEIKADKCFFKPIMIHQFPNNSSYVEKVERKLWSENIASRYIKDKNGKLRLPDLAIQSSCPKMNETVILSDGEMIMCCYDKEGLNRFGNLKNYSFEELWQTSFSFRNETMKNRLTSFCHSCIENKLEDICYEC